MRPCLIAAAVCMFPIFKAVNSIYMKLHFYPQMNFKWMKFKK